MKRIFIALACISMFFTGCSMLPKPIEPIVPTTAALSVQEVDAKAERDSNQSIKEQEEAKAEMFAEMAGEKAFYFPDNHLVSSGNLGEFQILHLENNYFYYLYDAVYGTDENSDKRVRAVLRYDYKKRAYIPLYERIYTSDSDTSASSEFYGQYINKTADFDQVFIYDEGHVYIYDAIGTKVFERDLNDMLDNYLPTKERNSGSPIVSRDITNVVMDANDRIYLEISLSDQDYDENTDEDDIEEDEIESFVLMYRYSRINQSGEYFYSENKNAKKAMDDWKSMADGKTLTSTPNANTDWATACRENKVAWTPYYYSRTEDDKIKTGPELRKWKQQGEQFQDLSIINLFMTMAPKDGTWDPVKDLTRGQKFWPNTGGVEGADGMFVITDGNYAKLQGTVGTVTLFKHGEVSRTFKVKKTENGVTTTTSVTQKLTNVPNYKKATLDGYGYSEELALMTYNYVSSDDHQNIVLYNDTNFGLSDHMLVLLNQQLRSDQLRKRGEVFLVNAYDGKYDPQGDVVIVETVEDSDTFEKDTYVHIQFRTGNDDWDRLGTMDGTYLHFSDLEASNTEDDREILSAVTAGGGGNVSLYSISDHYGADNMLPHYVDGKAQGAIVTTLNSGIVYARLNEADGKTFNRYYQYSNYPMYQTWQVGANDFISVGFAEAGDFSWEDIVYARVHRYKLDLGLLEKNSFRTRTIKDDKVEDSGPRETEAPPILPEMSDDMKEQVQEHGLTEYETDSGTDYQTAEQTQEVLQGELESMWNENESK